MQKYKKIGYVSLMLLVFVGCEDIITVDLNYADPTTVIEATITDDNTPSRVVVTKSTDFYTPGVYPSVSDALITVSDSEGNTYKFNQVEDGVYENASLISKPNVKYSIEVFAEGKTYNAASTVPNKLIIDSLSLEEAINRPGTKEGTQRFTLHVHFQDQPGIEDYGRVKIYSNGVQLGGFIIYSDKYTDGNEIDFRITLSTERDEINIGDLITVELFSIDKAAFNYYLTANSVNATGSNGRGPSSTSAAPTNPVTNWSNKALGFFSAYTISKKEIILLL